MRNAKGVGRVSSVHVYPLKSADGVEAASARVLPTGLEHDRCWAVRAGDDVLTARSAPALRHVRARPPSGDEESPSLLLADGDVTGPDADAALSRPLGREIELRRADSAQGFAEVAPVHLVSRQAVERAAADEGTALGDPACSVEQPRANVVLDLADDELETAWVGRELHLGDVVLRVSKQPKQCLGVYADVVRPGTVRIGDEVTLG